MYMCIIVVSLFKRLYGWNSEDIYAVGWGLEEKSQCS